MPLSQHLRAKRALVKVLLAMASAYSVVIRVNRDSDDKDILSAYRRVALKAHPDKGGDTRAFQQLQSAKDEWDAARSGSGGAVGRPPRAAAPGGAVTGIASASRQEKRVRSSSVLLTYFGRWSVPLWKSFNDFVRSSLAQWNAKHWCTTLEKSQEGKLHVHLQVQFSSAVDTTVRFYAWGGRCPNASEYDYLGGQEQTPPASSSSPSTSPFSSSTQTKMAP